MAPTVITAGLANPATVWAGVKMPVSARATMMPMAVLSTEIFSVINIVNDAIRIMDTNMICIPGICDPKLRVIPGQNQKNLIFLLIVTILF